MKISTFGPPSEADIEQQVSILEDVISGNPDAIVISSTSSDATIPAIERAMDSGIPVVTIDNRVNTDKVTSFIATDNIIAGGRAAEEMLKMLKERYGDDLSGKAISVVSSIAGVKVMEDRDSGFLNKMKEIAPEIEIIEPQYCDNDMTKAMSITEDLITANDNLVGLYGGNNITGSGISRVISQLGKEEDIVVIAFDSDPEEVKGLEAGSIDALVVQDPYGMGYQGVDFVYKTLMGETVDKEVETPVALVTRENFKDEAIQGLLDPYSRKINK